MADLHYEKNKLDVRDALLTYMGAIRVAHLLKAMNFIVVPAAPSKQRDHFDLAMSGGAGGAQQGLDKFILTGGQWCWCVYGE